MSKGKKQNQSQNDPQKQTKNSQSPAQNCPENDSKNQTGDRKNSDCK